MNLRTVLRMIGRDWKGGELLLLVAALVIAVATVTSVGLLVDRLGQALIEESADFLAADRRITSSSPIPAVYQTEAQRLSLEVAETTSFVSMVHTPGSSQLVSVKAVSSGYPLRGALRIANAPFAEGRPANDLPAAGEVWLDGRLFPILGLSIGDQVEIGAAVFRVGRVVVSEPDRGGSMYDLGPRLLMNISDLPKTEVVQPGSRITYRLLLAGEQDDLEKLRIILNLDSSYRWESVRESSPTIGAALERAESFLLIGSLLAVVLASLSVALSASRYVRRHYDHVAIMKTLGAGPNQIIYMYSLLMIIVAAFSIGVGLLLGGGLHLIITNFLKSVVVVTLPLPTMAPLFLGIVTGLVCALSFVLPPILDLRKISPTRVIQRDFPLAQRPRYVGYIWGLGCMLFLLVWYTDNLALAGWTLLGGSITIGFFSLLAKTLLKVGRVAGMQAGSSWRLALAGLQRRASESSFQIIVFGLAIMLLLVLYLLRTELLEQWQREMPSDAHNHYALNISPGQISGVTEMLAEETDEVGSFYPMIRGRVVGVNGVSVEQWESERGPTPEGGPRLSSERNLTHAEILPEGNIIVSGDWWAKGEEKLLVSLEEQYAKNEGLQVGDLLEFDVGGMSIFSEVANVRRLDWQSMRPNFFIIFSPSALKQLPTTFLTSFYLSPEKKKFLNDLLGQYRTITVIEVDSIIRQLQIIIDRVSLAIEVVLLMIIMAGIMALLASIQASKDSRIREHSLIRAVGGRTRLIRLALAIEFGVLGLFAGIVAAIGAELTVAMLQVNIFNLDASLHGWVWWFGPILGCLLILTMGLLATRSVVSSSPLGVLRDTN